MSLGLWQSAEGVSAIRSAPWNERVNRIAGRPLQRVQAFGNGGRVDVRRCPLAQQSGQAIQRLTELAAGCEDRPWIAVTGTRHGGSAVGQSFEFRDGIICRREESGNCRRIRALVGTEDVAKRRAHAGENG